VRLLGEVEGLFPKVPIVVAENKADLAGPVSSRLRVSSTSGEGVMATLDLLLAKLTSHDPEGVLQPEAP